jgi:serine/threonine protein kinase
MGMAEIRDAFEAYASGELAEYELRSALRAEIQTQPGSVHRYAAMAAALRRRNLISADLEAAVVSDMNEVVAQSQPIPAAMVSATEAPTRSSMREPPPLEPPSLEPPPRLEPSVPGAPDAHAAEISQPSRPVAASTGAGGGSASSIDRSASRGGAWDTKERLAEPEAPVSLGMVLRDRFELIEVLGRGGMGVVYKAIDQREIENKGRDPYVAIKVLNDEFKRHPESARALQRESKKSMRLAHPNIVLVRDFDRDRGNVFMVMELLHGTPLDQLVLKQYPKGMPLDLVIEIVNGLGAALSYAHQQGIVHADFKPSNAFLSSQNVVKVLDFGVARVALALDRGDSTLFDAGKLNAVSPAYASIEMLVGEAPDPRDDIYGLACVTYFLLTGRHPFSGIDAIKARDSALLPMPINGLADQQWRAIRQALTFERWDRTPSVKEFLAQFCIDASKRTVRISPASRIASGATRLADGAAKKPWLIAAPAGALLAAGLAFLIVRALPKHPAPAPSSHPSVAQQAPPPPPAPSAAQDGVSVASLQQHLAALDVAAPEFLDRAVSIAPDLKLLEKQAPGDDAPHKFRAAVLAAMSKRVAYLLEHDNVADAKKVIAKVSDLLPPGTLKAYSSDSLSKRQELGHLIATAASTQKWADQLSAALKNVSAFAVPDDPLIRDARETSDTTFQLAADEARSRHASDQAGEYLSMGLSVNPQSSALQRAMLEIAKAPPAAQPAPAPTLAKAPPTVQPAPTPTLAKAPAETPAPSSAASSASHAAPIPASAPPVAASAPNSGVDQLMQQARQEMSEGNVDQALDTISAGLRKFGNDVRLKNMGVTYARVSEEHDRFDLSASVNVKSHQEYLSEIRSLAGDEDYPQIEQMLTRALANDIAQQQARGDRANVVAGLLKSGRTLFPEYADLLEHGQAKTIDATATPVVDKTGDPTTALK